VAGKETKIEVVEQMKIIVKQLENLKRQWEEDQVLLGPRWTALEQRLLAMPLPPDSAGAAATHDATYQQLVQLPPFARRAAAWIHGGRETTRSRSSAISSSSGALGNVVGSHGDTSKSSGGAVRDCIDKDCCGAGSSSMHPTFT
jgi:hypothetical protein